MYDISYFVKRVVSGSLSSSLLNQSHRNTVTIPSEVTSCWFYNDLPFAALFYINFIVIAICGLSYGSNAITYLKYSSNVYDTTSSSPNRTSSSSADFIGGIILSLTCGLVFSISLILSLCKSSHQIINATFLISIFICLLCGVVMFSLGYMVTGLSLLLLTVFSSVAFVYLRPYIIFSSIMLKVACRALRDMPTLFLITAVVLLFQAIFTFIWLLAAIGTATNEATTNVSAGGITYDLRQCSTYSYYNELVEGEVILSCGAGKKCFACICNGYVAYSSRSCSRERLLVTPLIFLLLSLLWTSGVCANVVHCTVASAVNRWWSFPRSMSHEHVWQGFKESLTRSFGSICFGSLIVAVVKTLRAIVVTIKNQIKKIRINSTPFTIVQGIVVSLLEKTLGTVEVVMEYFNLYAFCFVAIYGYSFIGSSKAAVDLFRDRGWTAVINDDIIDYVLYAAHISIGVLCSLLLLAYCHGTRISSVNTTLLVVLAYNSGHSMSAVTTKLISSAVASIFVCFAEKTELFQLNHPELHRELLEAWVKFYPNEAPGSENGHGGEGRGVGGSYIPPHLIPGPSDTSCETRGNSYLPVFNRDDEDPESAISLSGPSPHSRAPQQTGFVITGRYDTPKGTGAISVLGASSPDSIGSSAPSQPASISSMLEGIKEVSISSASRASALVGQWSLGFRNTVMQLHQSPVNNGNVEVDGLKGTLHRQDRDSNLSAREERAGRVEMTQEATTIRVPGVEESVSF